MKTNNTHGGGGGGYIQPTSTVSNGFTPVQNGVLTFLKTITVPAGCSVNDICKQLKQFNENQVKCVAVFSFLL